MIESTRTCYLYLDKINRKLKHQQDIHSKKLFDIGFESSLISYDTDKVNFNYSSHVLTESERILLCKGLKFFVPSKLLEYADYLLPYEITYRDIHNLDIAEEKK